MNRVPCLRPMPGGGERRRGNKKGTNPSPPDCTGRTRRTAIVLRTPPRVLSSTAANCGPPFGTKRPQVQILSPRPVFPQARGPAPSGVGPSVWPVPQRSTATVLIGGTAQPAQRFAGRRRAGVRIDLQRHRHVGVTMDPIWTRQARAEAAPTWHKPGFRRSEAGCSECRTRPAASPLPGPSRRPCRRPARGRRRSRRSAAGVDGAVALACGGPSVRVVRDDRRAYLVEAL